MQKELEEQIFLRLKEMFGDSKEDLLRNFYTQNPRDISVCYGHKDVQLTMVQSDDNLFSVSFERYPKKFLGIIYECDWHILEIGVYSMFDNNDEPNLLRNRLVVEYKPLKNYLARLFKIGTNLNSLKKSKENILPQKMFWATETFRSLDVEKIREEEIKKMEDTHFPKIEIKQ